MSPVNIHSQKSAFAAKARNEQFALENKFFRQTIMQLEKQLILRNQLALHIRTVDFLHFGKSLSRVFKAGPFEIFIAGHPANRRLLRRHPSVHPVENPFEHTHVFAETGPEKVAVSVFSKPIHVKNCWRLPEALRHPKPISEIIAQMIAAERQHGHWIAPHLAGPSSSRSRPFTRHSRPEIDAISPNA